MSSLQVLHIFCKIYTKYFMVFFLWCYKWYCFLNLNFHLFPASLWKYNYFLSIDLVSSTLLNSLVLIAFSKIAWDFLCRPSCRLQIETVVYFLLQSTLYFFFLLYYIGYILILCETRLSRIGTLMAGKALLTPQDEGGIATFSWGTLTLRKLLLTFSSLITILNTSWSPARRPVLRSLRVLFYLILTSALWDRYY